MHKRRYVYRLTYQALRGKITRRTILHHRCPNIWCVNPLHVEPMTQGDHLRQHDLPGDWGQADKTHCPAGHPYSEENTYRWRNERQCRICRRAAKERYNLRHR